MTRLQGDPLWPPQLAGLSLPAEHPPPPARRLQAHAKKPTAAQRIGLQQ